MVMKLTFKRSIAVMLLPLVFLNVRAQTFTLDCSFDSVRTRNRAQKTHRRAVTLLELLVSIALIGMQGSNSLFGASSIPISGQAVPELSAFDTEVINLWAWAGSCPAANWNSRFQGRAYRRSIRQRLSIFNPRGPRHKVTR